MILLQHETAALTVAVYSKRDDGKRDYRKTNHCLFCKRSVTSKISAHYLEVHDDEEKVKQANQCPIGSLERRKILLELEHRGNFLHNCKVIEKGDGVLVVARRPYKDSETTNMADLFLPCEYCLGFFVKDTLWNHMKTCILKPFDKPPSINYVRNARTILEPFLPKMTEEETEVENIFVGLKETTANPGIPDLCSRDPLIREFAKSALCRLRETNERVKEIENIRTKVRTVGRLLKQLQETAKTSKPLSYFISDQQFFSVVQATKTVAVNSDSPQVAIVLGHYIKHVALLKKSIGIQHDNPEDVTDSGNFQEMYQAHWNKMVLSVAKKRQTQRHINKPIYIPITEDLLKLNNWIQEEIGKIVTLSNPDRDQLVCLAKLTLVRIALFNKRQISEVAELKVTDCVDAQENDAIGKEIFQALDTTEKILSKRMKVVEVRGKSTEGFQKVCILLTPDMNKALDYITRNRRDTNPYMFCSKMYKFRLDGCSALRKVTIDCPRLEDPSRIRTREMRKYLATTSQIFAMTEPELKMLADHMANDMNIHTDVNRLQSSCFEKAKVAQVLVASEEGQMNRFHGKLIQDLSSEEQVNERDDTDEEPHVFVLNPPKCADETIPNKVNTDNQDSTDQSVAMKRKSEDQQDKYTIKRVRWTSEENDVFRRMLGANIQNKTIPPGTFLRQVAEKISGRTIAQIRKKLYDIITGKLLHY